MSGRTAGTTARSVAASLGVESLLDPILPGGEPPACTCTTTVADGTLRVDASDCSGDLAASPACRRTVIETMVDRSVTELSVRDRGLKYGYSDRAVDLLAAGARFVDLLGDRHDRLSETAVTDPLSVADELRDRVDPIANIASRSGLLDAAGRIDDYEAVLSPTVGLSVGHYFLDRRVSDRASLRDVTSLETGSRARVYDRPEGVPLYALDLVDTDLDAEQRQLVLEGYEAIAKGLVDGQRLASEAIKYVADGSVDPRVTAVLEKHTSGYGILEDFFADPRVTDVYVTSPVTTNPVRVVVDGELLSSNVYVTRSGGGALASRVRKTSGRAFSRASPTIDATASLNNGTGIRIAGVTDPVADGAAFAFRERAEDAFTLPALIANGTLTAEAAAFLSVAVERNAATLIAGTRGAGKTTLLGTLMYELAPGTRTVVIEDTPELPVEQLQRVDRDVQALRTGTGDGPEITVVDALRTALRLGDGALVVGEIRGEEAQVLYEAMRVGANANAVLGTIHGDGAADVYERVVSDLDVPPSSFSATDLVVTVQAYQTPDGRTRRLSRIEEVVEENGELRFEPLYEPIGDEATSTDRIGRGESRLVGQLAKPTEEYADLVALVDARRQSLADLAADGTTDPREVAVAYGNRGTGQPANRPTAVGDPW
ncbi:type II/IV secretion system ATPase subunit [Halapricum hydrolyticum]|uniref:Type II/IV secretion system ATPase subunit n=1 Tax=Halapricum hydrolyticum TaxID=2979991 RepID=A0AAE3LEW9_9EURY|nr:type II/IV secretion system ATPase subunit [Halapricum hydrolyticum]MCU4717768.1 type II/IV secretion system ATPase subunit [Halapricum hydrolyticum]MCU4726932.1 type II/IV secretion system ATPase subunit [Halapricum hydrolyticum]